MFDITDLPIMVGRLGWAWGNSAKDGRGSMWFLTLVFS